MILGILFIALGISVIVYGYCAILATIGGFTWRKCIQFSGIATALAVSFGLILGGAALVTR